MKQKVNILLQIKSLFLKRYVFVTVAKTEFLVIGTTSIIHQSRLEAKSCQHPPSPPPPPSLKAQANFKLWSPTTDFTVYCQIIN